MPASPPAADKLIIKAAKAGHLEAVQALLAIDPELIRARDADDSTPLHCAAWKGHRDLAAFLLNAGADPNIHNRNDHWGTTPLHAAAHADHADIVQLLIDHGADVNAQDLNGQSPLHHTTFHKAKAAAKILSSHS